MQVRVQRPPIPPVRAAARIAGAARPRGFTRRSKARANPRESARITAAPNFAVADDTSAHAFLRALATGAPASDRGRALPFAAAARCSRPQCPPPPSRRARRQRPLLPSRTLGDHHDRTAHLRGVRMNWVERMKARAERDRLYWLEAQKPPPAPTEPLQPQRKNPTPTMSQPFRTGGRDYDRFFSYWVRRFQGRYGGAAGYPHDANPEVEYGAKRAAQQHVELEKQRMQGTHSIMRAGAAPPPYPRMPGGNCRYAQRSRARALPPMPKFQPMLDLLRTVVLNWRWSTRSKRNDLWRLRAAVALCVVLAVKRCTPMTRVCAMLPHEVLALPMPYW